MTARHAHAGTHSRHRGPLSNSLSHCFCLSVSFFVSSLAGPLLEGDYVPPPSLLLPFSLPSFLPSFLPCMHALCCVALQWQPQAPFVFLLFFSFSLSKLCLCLFSGAPRVPPPTFPLALSSLCLSERQVCMQCPARPWPPGAAMRPAFSFPPPSTPLCSQRSRGTRWMGEGGGERRREEEEEEEAFHLSKRGAV